jgi:hypothetical protein
MNHRVHAVTRPAEPLEVTNIAEQPPHTRVGWCELGLFELVAAERTKILVVRFR